ncbi:MAG: pitrilysin family protein [Saprospiraceae bacterium]
MYFSNVITFAAMSSSINPPEIQAITQLNLPEYEVSRLPNGIPMYVLRGGSEPVMKVEVVFRAGGWHETKSGVAEFMAGLMSEGTQKLTSAQLAEYIESRGATIQTRGGVDTVRVRLYTLTRYLPELMDVITDVINSPAFDAGELKVYAENKVERLKIDLKKNEVLAYRHLTEAIYGPAHPYGKNMDPEHFLTITSDDLREHHQRYIKPEKAMVFVSGSFGAKEIDLLHHTLGQWTPAHSNGISSTPDPEAISQIGLLEFDGPQSHQAAIRIGCRLFPQDHPDYAGLYVLNTILGGYFGSRLMTEIRENLGMTYGIYSSIDSFAKDGCFYISTETATDNITAVIGAIRAEVHKLRDELIPEEELMMARNYLMGHLMTQLDGPFSSLDFIKSMKIEHLEAAQFAHLIGTIQSLTPENLKALANRYLDLDQWATIVVR